MPREELQMNPGYRGEPGWGVVRTVDQVEASVRTLFPDPPD